MEKPHLNETQRKFLLQVARETLERYLNDDPLPTYSVTDPALLQPDAVFVTLWRKKDNGLRGCVGRLETTDPLYKTVQECAIAAATRDFRFPPVHAGELPDLRIEISVLTPPQRIHTPEEVEVGRHGLLIRRESPDYRAGLLLPEVATRRNWDRYQFLEAVCQKAGLPLDAWKTANLFVFETEVFEEPHD